MFLEVFFCDNNVSKGLKPVIEKLKEQYSDIEIYIEPCLGHCYQCSDQVYAVIDALPIGADSPEELYIKLVNYITLNC